MSDVIGETNLNLSGRLSQLFSVLTANHVLGSSTYEYIAVTQMSLLALSRFCAIEAEISKTSFRFCNYSNQQWPLIS